LGRWRWGRPKFWFKTALCAYTNGSGRPGPVYEVVAMSTHSMERSAWSSTKWVWILLAICLIGWRISSRVDQYHPSIVSSGHQAQVSFFDANERNIASIDATRSHSRLVVEQTDRLLPVAGLEPPVRATYRRQWEDRTALPPIYVDSVSLFSNPPPPSLT